MILTSSELNRFALPRRLMATRLLILGLALLSNLTSAAAAAQQSKTSFTVADEIGLRLFEDQFVPEKRAVRFSPNRQYVAVYSERGRLDINRVEGMLRFYRTKDLQDFLDSRGQINPPAAAWVVTRSPYKEGRVMKDWRWLADSTGVAYLEREKPEKQRLVLADLRTKKIYFLSSAMESVEAFDVINRHQYVYSTRSAEDDAPQHERQSVVGTGRCLYELLFPNNPNFATLGSLRRTTHSHLWVVRGGKRFEVQNNGVPLDLQLDGLRGRLLLSPDGHSVVAPLALRELPPSWAVLYPAPSKGDAYRIRPNKIVHQFVLIDLKTASTTPLTNAPLSHDAGLWATTFANPTWSADGKAILLPGTFLEPGNNLPSRPCIAVIDFPTHSRTCLEMLGAMWPKQPVEQGLPVADAQFLHGSNNHVLISFSRGLGDWEIGKTKEYRRTAEGQWQLVTKNREKEKQQSSEIEVMIKQGLNDPPLLVAKNEKTSRIVWDPNPQLKNFDLGEATIYTWAKDGMVWKGGLYKPVHYRPGQRYPLVIQTHGFVDSEFRPSGIYPSGFAARVLAAADILVLQSTDAENCIYATPGEDNCAISGYEAAINQLVSQGLVDPEKLGIIGFSHTGGYVLQELTRGSFHFQAALNEDTDVVDYFRYMTNVDYGSEVKPAEFDTTVGARPFGDGLQLWLTRNPGFNLDRVTTPLRIVVHGPDTFLLENWESYASLRYLHKPVDLILLNPDNVKGTSRSEHVLSTPALRMEAQGGSVDWFRFWLQGYEDPSPIKREQYARWRELRTLEEQNSKSVSPAN